MTDPVKTLGRSRWKRLRGEAAAPPRQMFRDTSVEVNDITVLSVKRRLVIKLKEVATGRTVIFGELSGNAYRNRIKEAIKKTDNAKLEAQAPAVAEPAQSPDLAKFMSAFGSLKGKGVFGDDAVEFQREMREEWR
ncbi:hypothetical protein [Massilia antarctica]|uniref:hypothetical protein n=1 Tax=Massilia antarctica TaxID=2765360 RepID=UPI00073E8FA5|nr:hypothetical protein [Massilia sp. H27-R4]MCY0915765.1 hypothetical protein [Massilia sp. H27-R4]